jgi:predicted nucleotidyltransferase component of viral defense system
MQELRDVERFEMELLRLLQGIRMLDRLYFGGGTMLRLCHNLKRYSTDLDFWIRPDTDYTDLFRNVSGALSEEYDVTDAEEKAHTLLFEVRSPLSVRRVILEMRKDQTGFVWERKIAFSRFSTLQIPVRGLTLFQMMKNKVQACLSRGLIRDFFDLEFLLFRGIHLEADPDQADRLLRRAEDFNDRDFRVSLGSLLEEEDRRFYAENRFQLLREELVKRINESQGSG